MNISRNIKNLKWVFYGVLVLVVVILVVGELIMPEERAGSTEKVVPFPGTWYHVQGDDRMAIPEPQTKVDTPRGETLVIESVIPDDVEDNMYIAFRGSQQTASIYVDGIIRTVYDTKDTRVSGKNSCSAYIFSELSHEDAGKKIRIEIVSDSLFSGVVNEMMYGTEHNIWIKIIYEHLLEIALVFFVLITGLAVVLIGFALGKRKRKEVFGVEMLGWVIFFAGFVCVTESHVRQLLFPNISLVADMTYQIVALLILAMMIFTNEVQGRRYRKVYVIISGILIVTIGMIYLLYFVGLIELFNSLPVIIVVGVAGLVAVLTTIILDLRSGDIKDYAEVGMGLIALELCQLIAYFSTNVVYITDSMGLFISVGCLILLFGSIRVTLRTIIESNDARRRAEYEKDARERFFAGMAHEFRTPINGILGMNEMILRECEDETILGYARTIKTSGRSLQSTVNDLLDFSKADSDKLKLTVTQYRTVNMLADTIRIVEDGIVQKSLSLSIDVDSTLPSGLIGDEIRIRQILTNLLSNAIKYTAEGLITIHAWREVSNEYPFVLCLAVEDTGQGIKEENRGVLFDSFARFEEKTNVSIEGTGLGLWITKQLITLMKGSIDVKSEFGKGSTFTVRIPQEIYDVSPMGSLTSFLDSSQQETAKEKTVELKAPGKRVLIVDDNPINIRVIRGILKNSEISFIAVTSGKKCIECCEAKDFDLILLDHMMPEMDGIETLARLKEDPANRNKNTPVVALTANNYEGIREFYVERGFDDYISKPINTDTIAEHLHALLPGSKLV